MVRFFASVALPCPSGEACSSNATGQGNNGELLPGFVDNSVSALNQPAAGIQADEDLMLAYADGDAAAFDILYERHRGPLYRYFLRQLPADQANDCFQTLWLKLINARSRYQPDAPLKRFLFALAHNVLMDHYRRNRRLVAVESEDLEVMALAAVGENDSTFAEANREQLAQTLHSLIQALPLHQREAWLLQQEAGLSQDEIAQLTQTSGEGVKSRLRYARAKLKAGLKAYARQN